MVDEILKRNMFITTIYSNGLLVTDAFLDELEKRGIQTTIQFSFDGVDHHGRNEDHLRRRRDQLPAPRNARVNRKTQHKKIVTVSAAIFL